MSERGALTSGYFYCKICFEKFKKYFEDNFDSKYLNIVPHPSLPILSGKIGGMFRNEEIIEFSTNIMPDLEELLCEKCTINFAVLADSGDGEIFTLTYLKDAE